MSSGGSADFEVSNRPEPSPFLLPANFTEPPFLFAGYTKQKFGEQMSKDDMVTFLSYGLLAQHAPPPPPAQKKRK